MVVKLNSWFRGAKRICNDSDTLYQLDGFNKTRYSRRKNQEGLLEVASREAHNQKKVYFATVFDGETPYCFLECNQGYFYVGFLDEKLRVYLSYKFDELSSDKLFLEEVMCFYFEDDDNDSNRADKYIFKPNGELIISAMNYRTHEQETLTAREPLSGKIVEHLWVGYPEFGQYDELIKLDRIPSEVFGK